MSCYLVLSSKSGFADALYHMCQVDLLQKSMSVNNFPKQAARERCDTEAHCKFSFGIVSTIRGFCIEGVSKAVWFGVCIPFSCQISDPIYLSPKHIGDNSMSL